MLDRRSSRYLEDPAPTFQKLNSEDFQGASPSINDDRDGIFHSDHVDQTEFSAELGYLQEGVNFDTSFLPSVNDQVLPAIPGWLPGTGMYDDSQLQLESIQYGSVEQYDSPRALSYHHEPHFDSTTMPYPGTPPLFLGQNQLIQQDERPYLPLRHEIPQLGEQSAGSYPQASPVTIPNRPAGLPRRRSRYSLCRLGQIRGGLNKPNDSSSLDPMQRWQESPPEDEPASLSAIMNAVNQSERGGEGPSISGESSRRHSHSFRHHRPAASLASSKSGTSVSSWQSSASTRSAVSTPRTARSQSGTRVGKSKRKSKKPSGLENDRIFCCTFCCDTFKNKFDWTRHEKSLHLNLGSWACTPHGGAVVSNATGKMHCAYCDCLEPTPEHLEEHNHSQCSDSTRVFRRKDHLVQHLRLVHNLETLPSIDDWRIPGPTITSRCGFCDQRLKSWDARADHLAAHFRQGMTMSDWQGDHDFPPDIAAKVINSLPPYLLSWESNTMVPFSASNKTAQDHLAQISARADWVAANARDQTQNEPPGALEACSQLPPIGETMVPLKTFTGILTQHLSRYARQQMSMGIIPTDEMFQQESRKLLYDSEDSWNQSIADNPAWISSFRQQLQVQPNSYAGRGTDQLEHTMAEFNTK